MGTIQEIVLGLWLQQGQKKIRRETIAVKSCWQLIVNKQLRERRVYEYSIHCTQYHNYVYAQIKKELRGAQNTYKTHALQYVQYVHCTVYSITAIISKYKCGKIYLKICHLCTVEL